MRVHVCINIYGTVIVKVKDKVVPAHVMNILWHGSKAPLILILSTRWRRVVSLMPQPPYLGKARMATTEYEAR